MKSEIIQKEKCDMVVMDVKIDNFICFRNFHMNMSYPKKIVGSYIENEFFPVPEYRLPLLLLSGSLFF